MYSSPGHLDCSNRLGLISHVRLINPLARRGRERTTAELLLDLTCSLPPQVMFSEQYICF